MLSDSNKNAPDVSIIVPVYGSEETLRVLYSRIKSTLESTKYSFEVILIDDASPDDSWQVLLDLQKRHPENVTAIQLMRNYGQHNALMCGFKNARGKYVVTIDDDLQIPPEEIAPMLEQLVQSKMDLVYGKYVNKKHATGRNLGSTIVNTFFQFVFKTHITVTSFRAIRKELVDSILSYDLNFTFIDGLLAWNTQRITDVAVEHRAREHSKSQYSLSKLVTLALNLFTNFSLLPLQIASGLGLASACTGFVTGIFYLTLHLMNKITVPGYASIIIAVLILGGTQLIALGIIGEYVGRLHINVNRKPQYTVRTKVANLELDNQD